MLRFPRADLGCVVCAAAGEHGPALSAAASDPAPGAARHRQPDLLCARLAAARAGHRAAA